MGFLRNILLALAALAVVESGVEPLRSLPAAAVLLVPLPHVLALLARAAGIRGWFRTSTVLAGAVDWSAPFAQVVAVLVFGWSDAVVALVDGWAGLDAASGPALLGSLLPYAAVEAAAIDARARAADGRSDVRAGMRRLQGRLLLSGLVPVIAYALVSGLIALHPTVRAWVEGVDLVNALLAAALLAAFALTLPALLRSTWETAPLEPGFQRAVLEETGRRAGFRCKEICVWRTSNLMANAAIVGFLPRHRVVLLSDALLAQLGPAELAAVFAHEVGHATRRHAWIFGAWALGFFMLADVLLRWLAPGSLGAKLGTLGVLLAVGYLAFGYLSRRFELDADLASVGTTGDAGGLIRALEQVGGVHARERTSWRHFSVAERVRFLAANARDPSVGRRLRRWLSPWAVAGIAVFVAGLVLELAALVEALPADRVGVELRLGRYGAAVERAAGLELDDRRRAAVDAAAEIEDGAPPELLEALAWEALERGELAEAAALLDLLVLRQEDAPEGVSEALQAALEGDPDTARELARTVDPVWAEALADALRER